MQRVSSGPRNTRRNPIPSCRNSTVYRLLQKPVAKTPNPSTIDRHPDFVPTIHRLRQQKKKKKQSTNQQTWQRWYRENAAFHRQGRHTRFSIGTISQCIWPPGARRCIQIGTIVLSVPSIFNVVFCRWLAGTTVVLSADPPIRDKRPQTFAQNCHLVVPRNTKVNKQWNCNYYPR